MTKGIDFDAKVRAMVEEHVAAIQEIALERLRGELAKVRTAATGDAGAGADDDPPPRKRTPPRHERTTRGSRRSSRPSTSPAKEHKPKRDRVTAAAPAGSSRPRCRACGKSGHNARTCGKKSKPAKEADVSPARAPIAPAIAPIARVLPGRPVSAAAIPARPDPVHGALAAVDAVAHRFGDFEPCRRPNCKNESLHQPGRECQYVERGPSRPKKFQRRAAIAARAEAVADAADPAPPAARQDDPPLFDAVDEDDEPPPKPADWHDRRRSA